MLVVLAIVHLTMLRVGVAAVTVTVAAVVLPLMVVIGAGVMVAVVDAVNTVVNVDAGAVEVEVTLDKVSLDKEIIQRLDSRDIISCIGISDCKSWNIRCTLDDISIACSKERSSFSDKFSLILKIISTSELGASSGGGRKRLNRSDSRRNHSSLHPGGWLGGNHAAGGNDLGVFDN